MWTQRGHRGCTSTGTEARANGTVRVRVRHVIDRGSRRGAVCKAKESSYSTKREGEEGIE